MVSVTVANLDTGDEINSRDNATILRENQDEEERGMSKRVDV